MMRIFRTKKKKAVKGKHEAESLELFDPIEWAKSWAEYIDGKGVEDERTEEDRTID